jgi:signal transduction histidine kinase
MPTTKSLRLIPYSPKPGSNQAESPIKLYSRSLLEQELLEARSKQQYLTQVNEQLNRENEQLTEFITSIAHEINNPLQVALSFITFLREKRGGQISETQQDYLNAATAGVKQAQALIQDLLCDAQLARLQLDVDLKPVDLRKVARETFEQFKLLASTSNVTLRGFNLEGPACMVLGAENRLQQCLINLLNNALKFSPKGGMLRLALILDEGTYLVMVADQGPGISPQNQELIFQRHYQVKDGSGGYHAGYGLGLSITRELIELQGGTIGVVSEPGRGSCFWFRLPQISAGSKN